CEVLDREKRPREISLPRPLPYQESDSGELAGADQLDQHVPLLLLKHGEVAGLADPALLLAHLDLGAGPAGRTEGHLHGLHRTHLLPRRVARPRPPRSARTATMRAWREAP